MSYKALYDILCSVKRHMNARVIFRSFLRRATSVATALLKFRTYMPYSKFLRWYIAIDVYKVDSEGEATSGCLRENRVRMYAGDAPSQSWVRVPKLATAHEETSGTVTVPQYEFD